ncbi:MULTISPECIES: hypothetical protein [Halorussus]|uniref:hypothetical protein n=1 Tax=Halorussus TaxID=1070314 RepID=UPI0020A0DDD8|nr:hypothetical protein [Halorussus vallis]USZ77066.1 hypothetical protein NGM07_07000 [Halorussus vallis]
MNRRKLVSIVAGAGLSSLAGCQSFGSMLRREPARFEDVAVSGPDEIGLGESFSLTVSVRNAGGRSGEFVDELTVPGAADSPTKVLVPDVAAGESRTVEVGPFSIESAGHHRLALAESGATHVVSVPTRRLRAGERFSAADGASLAVSNVSYHTATFYAAADGRGVVSPAEGSVLAAVDVSVANPSESEVAVEPARFSVADGETVALEREDGALSALPGRDAGPLRAGTLAPSEVRTGWVLAEVSRERATNGLSVAWNRERADGEERDSTTEKRDERSSTTGTRDERGSTTGTRDERGSTTAADDDSTPEAQWAFDLARLPAFEVTDLTTPAEIEVGSSFSATATVTNVGDAPGTYRAAVERRGDDESDWHRVATVAHELEPGANATVATEAKASTVGHARYRLRPGTATSSATVFAAERALGDRFTTPAGAAIRVDLGNDAFDGFLSSYIYGDSKTQTIRAERGYTFAFVRLSVENVAAERAAFPDWKDFSVVVDGTARAGFHSSSSGAITLRSPVDGSLYHPKGAYDPGATDAGWLVFRVPEGLAQADLAVRYAPDGEVTATWS